MKSRINAPLLLALDDAHRAHENLQRTLLNWLVGLRLEPIGLAITATSPPRGALADLQRTLIEREAGEVWTLRPFTLAEVIGLAQERLPMDADAESLSRALYELTGGNSLYLNEILNSLPEMGYERFHSLSNWIPDFLREALLRRFETLSVAEQEVARALSLFESVAPRDVIPAVANQTERGVSKGVAALQTLGWIEPQGAEELRWRNRLFREVVYSPSSRASGRTGTSARRARCSS